MDEYEDSTTSLVADVDCTAEGKELCEKHDVRSYPTIKYGDPADLKVYEGDRTLDDLKKFAELNLPPLCGLEHLDLCDADTKAKIEKWKAMDEAALTKVISEANGKLNGIDWSHQRVIVRLQDQAMEARVKKEHLVKKRDDLVKQESTKLGIPIAKKMVAYKENQLKEDKGGKGRRKKVDKKEL